MSQLEILESELRDFQIDLSSGQLHALSRYCDELIRWNKKINLTGLRGADLVRRLVVEPVWIGLQLQPKGILADVGSGNGSPAIPLHVVCGFEKTHLIEVRARKAAFLRHLVTTLTLANIIVHRAKFEDIASELTPVDWITLQGVALNAHLMNSIHKIPLRTTNVVWITSSSAEPPLNALRRFQVPFTGTEVFLFRVSVS